MIETLVIPSIPFGSRDSFQRSTLVHATTPSNHPLCGNFLTLGGERECHRSLALSTLSPGRQGTQERRSTKSLKTKSPAECIVLTLEHSRWRLDAKSEFRGLYFEALLASQIPLKHNINFAVCQAKN